MRSLSKKKDASIAMRKLAVLELLFFYGLQDMETRSHGLRESDHSEGSIKLEEETKKEEEPRETSPVRPLLTVQLTNGMIETLLGEITTLPKKNYFLGTNYLTRSDTT